MAKKLAKFVEQIKITGKTLERIEVDETQAMLWFDDGTIIRFLAEANSNYDTSEPFLTVEKVTKVRQMQVVDETKKVVVV